MVEVKQPFNYAHITWIEGEYGSGKSNTATARAIDATYANVTKVQLFKDGVPFYEVKASPALNEKGKPMTGFVTVHFPNKEPYVVEVPDDACVIADGVRVFANFHLYGIRYMKCDLADILEYLNTGLIKDGYVLVDEAYIGGDARNSATLLSKIITWFTAQIRKRRVNLIFCYPSGGKWAELRIRTSNTEHIICQYNEKTQMITLTIKKRREKSKTISYCASLYWRHYKTEEMQDIPEGMIGRALAKAV